MRAVALEVEDGVDQVLEHARAGERALLGHVADEKAGDTARLRARDVEDGQALARERAAGLEGERRLSDPRVAAHQHDRACDEPAAQHAVQLRETGGAAERRAGGDGGERPRLLAARRAGARAAGARIAEHLLDHRAPRAAARALPEPARRRVAALLADEGRPPRLVNHEGAPG